MFACVDSGADHFGEEVRGHLDDDAIELRGDEFPIGVAADVGASRGRFDFGFRGFKVVAEYVGQGDDLGSVFLEEGDDPRPATSAADQTDFRCRVRP